MFQEHERASSAVRLGRRSRPEIREILDAIDSVVVILSPAHRILEWNQEASRIFGHTRENVLGRDFLESCVPEASRDALAAAVLEATPMTQAISCPDGERRTLEWRFAPLAGGADPAIVACGKEVTDRELAAATLKAAFNEFRDRSAARADAVEAERLRLSREIHDTLGQSLSTISMGLSWLEEQELDASVETRIASLKELIASSIEQVRTMAADLRPAMLDDLAPESDPAVF